MAVKKMTMVSPDHLPSPLRDNYPCPNQEAPFIYLLVDNEDKDRGERNKARFKEIRLSLGPDFRTAHER